MKTIFLSILVSFLIVFLAQTSQSNTETIAIFLQNLTQLLVILITLIAPLLLFYGFLKSSIDAVKMLPLTLLLAQSSITETLDSLIAVLMSFFMIILPFTILLIFWKGFTKLVRA
ncbi:MAG: hypothetical protein QXZ63_07590 [Sulfolobales archaeon]